MCEAREGQQRSKTHRMWVKLGPGSQGGVGAPRPSQGKPLLTHPLYFQVRAEILTTFALCGFANFSSIGIMLGGLSESGNLGGQGPGSETASWGSLASVLPRGQGRA